MEILFWLSAVCFLQTWLLYPLEMLLAVRLRPGGTRRTKPADKYPGVSVIISAHNAAGRIGRKIEEVLGLDYPLELLEVIVVSDGSTDSTVKEAAGFKNDSVKVLELTPNQGKSAAQNFGVRNSQNEVIVFTDVDSSLERDFLQRVIPHFDDPDIVCVGGKVRLSCTDGQISQSQGLYWRVEQFLREAESSFGMLHSLPGWGFAIRANDFVELDEDTGDDMVLPLELALRGKHSVIENDAWVYDTVPSSLEGEFRSRQRITLRNLTGLMRRKALLNPLKFPRMAFAIWSHKLLRWMSPIFMLSILFSSLWLSISTDSVIYESALYVQMVGYMSGLLGLVASQKNVKIPLFGHISSFLLANLGFLMGLLRFLAGQRMRSYKNA